MDEDLKKLLDELDDDTNNEGDNDEREESNQQDDDDEIDEGVFDDDEEEKPKRKEEKGRKVLNNADDIARQAMESDDPVKFFTDTFLSQQKMIEELSEFKKNIEGRISKATTDHRKSELQQVRAKYANVDKKLLTRAAEYLKIAPDQSLEMAVKHAAVDYGVRLEPLEGATYSERTGGRPKPSNVSSQREPKNPPAKGRQGLRQMLKQSMKKYASEESEY